MMGLVVCCGMARSGGTKQYQLTVAVAKRYNLGIPREFGIHYTPGENAVVKFEEFKEKYYVPVKQGRARAIGIYRDPRDVVTSLIEWRRRQGKPYTFESRLWHRVFDRWQNWEPLCSHVARYEDCHPFNWAAEVVEIGRVFGVDIGPDEAREIAATWNVRRNIERQEAQGAWFNGETMLTQTHISPDRGRSRWRERLTPEQAREIEEYLGAEWMDGHGYRLLDSARE